MPRDDCCESVMNVETREASFGTQTQIIYLSSQLSAESEKTCNFSSVRSREQDAGN